MSRIVRHLAPAAAVLGLGAALVTLVGVRTSGQATGMPSTRNGDWTHYTADVRGRSTCRSIR